MQYNYTEYRWHPTKSALPAMLIDILLSEDKGE